MKTTGCYYSVSCDYDVDHEINRNIKELKKLIYGIDDDDKDKNKKDIIKTMISESMNEL